MNDKSSLIESYVEEYKEEIIELASELVKIPSENIAPNGDEKKCQDFICNYLDKIEGIGVDVFLPTDVENIENHPAYRYGRNYVDRPNVVASYEGGQSANTVIFSSHIDTVSIRPLPWKISDPFSGEVIDGKLYGRGSFDMKGGFASTLICLKIIAEKKIGLKGKVIVESVVDEENAGSNGTLASRLRGHNGDVVILPEPSLLSICPACKGGKQFKVRMQGQAGTGYGGEEIWNPIYSAGLLASSIYDYEKMINSHSGHGGEYYKKDANSRTVIVDKFQSGDLDPGGNIGIPDEAWFSLFVNTLPGYDEKMLDDELIGFMNQVIESNPEVFPVKPQIEGTSRYLWPHELRRDHPIIQKLVKAAELGGITNPVVEGAKFACDGFIFHKYFDIPTIAFGPRGGGAHAQDEYVEVDDLILLTKVYLNFVLDHCG